RRDHLPELVEAGDELLPHREVVAHISRSWRLRRRAAGPRSLLGGIPASLRSLIWWAPPAPRNDAGTARNAPARRRDPARDRRTSTRARRAGPWAGSRGSRASP